MVCFLTAWLEYIYIIFDESGYKPTDFFNSLKKSEVIRNPQKKKSEVIRDWFKPLTKLVFLHVLSESIRIITILNQQLLSKNQNFVLVCIFFPIPLKFYYPSSRRFLLLLAKLVSFHLSLTSQCMVPTPGTVQLQAR